MMVDIGTTNYDKQIIDFVYSHYKNKTYHEVLSVSYHDK